MRFRTTVILAWVAAISMASGAERASGTGILLLAHGGSGPWNERVLAVATVVNQTYPTEVAFGMASRATIQTAVDRLAARGVSRIVAVPLFVSSHSSVITSTEYLLGLRAEAPADLAVFAKMSHAAHGPPPGDRASLHAPTPDAASPVHNVVPIRLAPAFDRHPLIGQIVAERARSISSAPATEAVILVAHGPVPEDDNRKWLDDLAVLAEHVRASAPFASVDYLTVRDDAGPLVKEAATRELRAKVETQRAAGRQVLIVPHLMSFGGIEQGIRTRLEGLEYRMTTQGLMPDDRVVQWVLAALKP